MDRGRSRLHDFSGPTTRTRPSTPIEIPIRRHIVPSPSPSSNESSASPDLVFDMSPLSYEFSTSPHYSLTFSPSESIGERDSFMYSFPVYSPLQQSCSGRGKENNVPTDTKRASQETVLKTKKVAHMVKPSPTSSTRSHRPITTTKITGFVPLKQSPSLTSNQSSCIPTQKLSLSPRRLSLSSTPWTPPMKPKTREETTSSCGDFEKHLFRRIDAHRNMSHRLSMVPLMRR